jgi:RNA polymerase sigma-70 factor (ECF subfamily)
VEIGSNNSLLLQTTLSMSRLSESEMSPEAVEVANLVRLALSGDAAAFEQIVMRFERRVMTMAMRLLGSRDDAQDAAQEVFLRAFKYLHRLDLQRPIDPWLIRMTINVCRDISRRRDQRRNAFPESVTSADVAADDSCNPHTGLAGEQERRMLWKALDSLPAKERHAIVLRDVEGLSTSEVASIMQTTETTVRSQVSRGRLRLKESLDRMRGGRR